MNEIQEWGKELISFAILLPMVWYFIKASNKQSEKLLLIFEKHSDEDAFHLKALNETLVMIKNSINNQNEEVKKQFEWIRDNIWRKSISKEDAILLMKKSMLSWSYKKLDYLEKRLNKNNLQERQDVIKRQIKLELLKLSDEEYLIFLDWFIYNWKKLWDYIRENFKFEDFLLEVFDCIFDKHTADIPFKLKNVLEVMKVYQNECIENIKLNLK